MILFIDTHRERFGVEPICRTLQFAPSTYWSSKRRPVCARKVRDEYLKTEIARVYRDNFSVYGAPKIWAQLNREDIRVARCTVERLMSQLGIQGAVRGKTKRTTIAADGTVARPGDLVERNFTAPAPNRLWVADLTYVRTWSGFEQAVWELVHHSDRGVQYLSRCRQLRSRLRHPDRRLRLLPDQNRSHCSSIGRVPPQTRPRHQRLATIRLRRQTSTTAWLLHLFSLHNTYRVFGHLRNPSPPAITAHMGD
jgi:hypothetical protein